MSILISLKCNNQPLMMVQSFASITQATTFGCICARSQRIRIIRSWYIITEAIIFQLIVIKTNNKNAEKKKQLMKNVHVFGEYEKRWKLKTSARHTQPIYVQCYSSVFALNVEVFSCVWFFVECLWYFVVASFGLYNIIFFSSSLCLSRMNAI